MQNIDIFTNGLCALCERKIDSEWSNSPQLGTMCRSCYHSGKKVFKPENINFVVDRTTIFHPLLKIIDFRFDFEDTQVMINNKLYTITSTSCSGALAEDPSPERQNRHGEKHIHGLANHQLIELYKESGGIMSDQGLAFPPDHIPKKTALLETSTLIILPRYDNNRNLKKVLVGSDLWDSGNLYLRYISSHYPFLNTLHLFVNMATRYKFRLGDTHKEYEPGMISLDNGVKISSIFQATYTSDPIGIEAMAGSDNPTCQEIMKFWLELFTVMLRFDWNEFDMKSSENIWRQFCTMQDVALNIMTGEEIAGTINLARRNRHEYYNYLNR